MFLRFYGVQQELAIFCLVLVLVGVVSGLAFDFFRSYRFYMSLLESSDGLVREGLTPVSMTQYAHTHIERALSRAFDNVVAFAQNEQSTYKQQLDQYRDYVELWVHEIKTPIGAAQLIVENNPSPAMEDIATQMTRISELVEQTLFYARSCTLEKDFVIKQVRIDSIVDEALRTHARTLILAGVTPHVEHTQLMMRADAKWLVFIVGQLIINAARYKQDPAPSQGSYIQLYARQTNHTDGSRVVELVVEDNGLGIPEEDIKRVFDKGYVGKNGRQYAKSTGMGLYLVKELSQKMGLGVHLTSRVGIGTRFTISESDALNDVL